MAFKVILFYNANINKSADRLGTTTRGWVPILSPPENLSLTALDLDFGSHWLSNVLSIYLFSLSPIRKFRKESWSLRAALRRHGVSSKQSSTSFLLNPPRQVDTSVRLGSVAIQVGRSSQVHSWPELGTTKNQRGGVRGCSFFPNFYFF